MQASCQFDTVYGSAYARELRATFPAALIMYGADEMEMLQRGEQWSRETTRRQESFDQATGGKTLSSQLGPSLDYRRLLPQNRGEARLLRRGTAGITTELPDWQEFIAKYDRAVKTLLRQYNSASVDKPATMWDWAIERHRRAAKAIAQ
ncbi:hypothetical protein MOKP122_48390 [Mycobacterium avium subsp. hominissuis]